MYHGQLLPFIIIHQKVWGCMKKKQHSNGWKKKAYKWDRAHGLRFIYQCLNLFAKLYRKQSLALCSVGLAKYLDG